ncbi:hypothetical protein AB0G83_17105 [Streptomyces klenkii]|uniref:hypothetical protein n=1 Tax=Streptomyces klenkii TaxID=1420899 RepID=UPI0033DE2DBF
MLDVGPGSRIHPGGLRRRHDVPSGVVAGQLRLDLDCRLLHATPYRIPHTPM